MSKYNFFQLKRNKELPEDVNIIAEKVCSQLSGKDELNELLKDAKKRRIFGAITHYEKVAINGVESVIDAVRFKFRYGIVQEFIVKKLVGSSNIEERNIINDSVSFKKLGKE